MPRRSLPLVTCSLFFGLPATLVIGTEKVDFNRDIQPILSAKCFACHGPDAETVEGDLRVDLRESALDSGAIVPGKPDASTLVERILSDDPDELMPPSGN